MCIRDRPFDEKSIKMSAGVQNWWKSWKTMFYVFCIFTPLYRHSRLSRVFQIESWTCYRTVPSRASGTPWGSVFGHVWVQCKNLLAASSNIYRTSIENLLIIYPSFIYNTKTAQYRAIWHEIKFFWYETIDLFKLYRLRYTRRPETPI